MLGFLRRNWKPRSTDFFGWNTVYHDPDSCGHRRVYFFRVWLGRLRFHVFHTGDPTRDHHDHPWEFWTFPLNDYIEEVLTVPPYKGSIPSPFVAVHRQIVRRLRVHYRPATHTHRVLGAWSGEFERGQSGFRMPKPAEGRKVYTIVWSGDNTARKRQWGFWRNDGLRLCWMTWQRYILQGGKTAPCE